MAGGGVAPEVPAELLEWAQGTVVADAEGRPRVVHHFTYFEFETFDRLWGASWFGRDPEGTDCLGSWFTDNPAARYVSPDPSWKGRRMDVLLALRNPLVLADAPDGDAHQRLSAMTREAGGATATRTRLRDAGHDGVVLRETFLDRVRQTVFLVLEPEQVRVLGTVPAGPPAPCPGPG